LISTPEGRKHTKEMERQLQRFRHRCAWCYVHGKKENTEHRLQVAAWTMPVVSVIEGVWSMTCYSGVSRGDGVVEGMELSGRV
jgi:hypothetical protein